MWLSTKSQMESRPQSRLMLSSSFPTWAVTVESSAVRTLYLVHGSWRAPSWGEGGVQKKLVGEGVGSVAGAELLDRGEVDHVVATSVGSL